MSMKDRLGYEVYPAMLTKELDKVRRQVNIQPHRFIPTKPSHIQVGAFYQIVGTIANTQPEAILRARKADATIKLPPQMVQVQSPIRYDPLGQGCFDAILWCDCGEWFKSTPMMWRTVVHLHQVNVPEHGLHDHHLERIGDEYTAGLKKLVEQNAKDDYGEMVGYRVNRYSGGTA